MIRLLSAIGMAFALGAASPPSRPIASAPITMLSPAQARDDLERLHFTIEHAHGNAYRYISKQALNAEFAKVESSLDRPVSDLDFFRRIAPLVDAIRDSHTSMQPPEQLRRFFSNSSRTVFPLAIRYVAGLPIVESDLSTTPQVEPGSELMEIDGRPMAAVTSTLAAQVAVDGFNWDSKLTRIAPVFWYFYGFAYGAAPNYRVVVRDPKTGVQQQVLLEGVDPTKLVARQPSGKLVQKLEFPNPTVAVLTIDELSSPTTGQFLERSFAKIASHHTKDLIIDLRRCPGGDDKYNHELLSYLSPRPFKLYNARDFRVRNYDDLKYVDYALDDFITEEQARRLPAGKRANPLKSMTLPEMLTYMLSVDDATGTFFPAPRNRFKGATYVLVSGRSGSSAAELAALFHHLGIATIIGEEPNGAYQGLTAEAVPILTLPNSKISIRMPLVADHNAVVPGIFFGHGAPPTFPVSQTIADTLAGRDTVMRFTRDLIRRRRAG